MAHGQQVTSVLFVIIAIFLDLFSASCLDATIETVQERVAVRPQHACLTISLVARVLLVLLILNLLLQ